MVISTWLEIVHLVSGRLRQVAAGRAAALRHYHGTLDRLTGVGVAQLQHELAFLRQPLQRRVVHLQQ